MKRIDVILCIKLIMGVFWTFCGEINAQVPTVNVPKPATLTPNAYIGSFDGKSINRSTEISAAENKVINNYVSKSDENNSSVRDLQMNNYIINHISLPDFQNMPGTEYFRAARTELYNMLIGKQNMNIKRAIFLIENSYFMNKMSYKKYNDEIQTLKNLCLLKMKEEKLNKNDDLAKKMIIFRIMTDVIKVKEPGTEKTITHYPMKYDFNDYEGKKELSQLFVSKLLMTNSGQCHSMPLLFLILSEELNTDAYLAFSPLHSFIKFQDKENKWYNAELTRGAFVSDDFYMNSGFIKSESLRNKLYLDPLNKQQIIAHLLAELGRNYVRRYGYDNFVKQCLDISLKYYPNDIYAYTLYADYNTARALYVIERCGKPPKNDLPLYPQAYELYKKMHQSFAVIDSLGYEDMPSDVYQNWLKQVEKEKVRPENQPFPIKQFKN